MVSNLPDVTQETRTEIKVNLYTSICLFLSSLFACVIKQGQFHLNDFLKTKWQDESLSLNTHWSYNWSLDLVTFKRKQWNHSSKHLTFQSLSEGGLAYCNQVRKYQWLTRDANLCKFLKICTWPKSRVCLWHSFFLLTCRASMPKWLTVFELKINRGLNVVSQCQQFGP